MFEKEIAKLEAYEPPNDFEPLMVEYRVSTALLSPQTFGDALVARMLAEDVLGDDFYNLPAKNPIPMWKHLKLPLKKTGDVYHSSVSIFDTDARHTKTLYKRFHEADGLKSRNRVRLNSGYFRSFMIKFPFKPVVVQVDDSSIPAFGVRFFMNGNLKELEKILKNVRNLGKKRAQGGGQVASFFIKPIEDDWSLIKDGIAMRSLPVEMLSAYSMSHVMLMAYRMPYWDNANVTMCVAPGGACQM